MSKKYRMYCDEVGNTDLNASTDPNHRYLSLTGIIFELGYVDTTAHPKLEKIKKAFFNSHPDDPVILHRKELVNRKYPFHALRDKETEERFNNEILRLFAELEYKAITVVIDKLEHTNRYTRW